MKKLLFVVTALLVLIHFMTAFIGWPGGDSYSLVVKPYPSLLWNIPHMEVHSWKAAVASGEVPEWVVQGRYVELASSGHEVSVPPIVLIYMFSRLLTVAAVALTVLLLATPIFWRPRSKRDARRTTLAPFESTPNGTSQFKRERTG